MKYQGIKAYCIKKERTVDVCIDNRRLKALQAAKVVEEIIVKKLEEEPNYSGKILIELNCNSGGVGTIEAFVKREIK